MQPSIIQPLFGAIGSKAPNSMILMMTFAFVPHASFGLQDIRKLTNVNWSNAAVAYHGYYWCGRAFEEKDSIGALIRAGYAVINTEYADQGDWTTDTKRYEEMGIGWLNFQYVGGAGGSNMTTFKTTVDGSGLTWVPDYGTWPQPATFVQSIRGTAVPHHFAARPTRNLLSKDHSGVIIQTSEGRTVDLRGRKMMGGHPFSEYLP